MADEPQFMSDTEPQATQVNANMCAILGVASTPSLIVRALRIGYAGVTFDGRAKLSPMVSGGVHRCSVPRAYDGLGRSLEGATCNGTALRCLEVIHIDNLVDMARSVLANCNSVPRIKGGNMSKQ